MWKKTWSFFRAGADWIGDLVQILSPCRYSILVILIGGGAFLLVPQGQDVLRRLAEWGEVSIWQLNGWETLTFLGRSALFLLAVVIWALSSWYWARVILYLRVPGEPEDTKRRARFRVTVPRVLGVLAIVIMGASLARAAGSYVVFKDRAPMIRLIIFSVICFALAGLFLWFVVQRRKILRNKGWEPNEPTTRYASRLDLPSGTRTAAVVSLALSLVLGLLFTFAPISVGRALGTVPIVLITAATWVLFGTGILYLGWRLRIPLLLLLLALAFLFSGLNDNHEVRLAGSDTRPKGTDLTVQQQFQAWEQGMEGQPIFLVAAEGGGIRAAYWTAAVLARLHEIPGFSQHVFAFSGVSGGSLGGAAYVALLHEEATKGQLPCGQMIDCVDDILGQDFLSPTLARMVAPDLGQRFLFFPIPFVDRARALEDGWATAWRDVVHSDQLDQPFLSLWNVGREHKLPALLLNGTEVETGRRLLTTNLGWTKGDFQDTYDLLGVLGADVPLKTAIHNSARFTYISPAGTLRPDGKEPRGHVVDGGYFENSGSTTALELLSLIVKGCGSQCMDRIYVIYLRNSPETDPRQIPNSKDPTQRDKETETFTKSYPHLNELLSPPRALLAVREAHAALAVETLRAALPGRFFQMGLRERMGPENKKAPLPLGWQLSENAREAMKQQLLEGSENRSTFDAISRVPNLAPPPTAPAVLGAAVH